VLFGQGVLAFCKAEAIQLEAIQPSGDKTADGEILELQEKALECFSTCHRQFSEIHSPKHLEAVKCLTMMGLVNKCLGRLKAALECYAKEVAVRDEVQGEMHPRAQQARRVYNDLIEQVEARGGPAHGADMRVLLSVPVPEDAEGEGPCRRPSRYSAPGAARLAHGSRVGPRGAGPTHVVEGAGGRATLTAAC
jgi:hypothetical protein